MTKLFGYFALFCLIGAALSQACEDNALLDLYKLDPEPTEVDGDDLAFCKTLKAGTSCCSKTTVATFQDKIDTLAKTLAASVIKRDTAIVTLRDDTLPDLTTKLTTLKANAVLAIAAVEAAAEEPETREDEEAVAYTLDQAEELATSLEELVTNAMDDLKDATEGFTDFQKARTTCVKELLGLQAAAYCLACDPDLATKGANPETGAIDIADEICERLQGSCFDYVTGSAAQSAILAVGTISKVVDGLATALKTVADDKADAESLQALADAVAANDENEVDDEAVPVSLPTGCATEAGCVWICESLFVDGEVDLDNLLLAGDAYDPTAVTPTVPAGPGRRLQTGEWAPDADEAGVTVTWEDDPAGVNSDDTVTPAAAGIIKSGFVCLVALLSVFFF